MVELRSIDPGDAMKAIHAVAICLFSFGTLAGTPAVPPAMAAETAAMPDGDYTSKPIMLAILKSGDFRRINKMIAGYQKDFKKGLRSERAFNGALNAFAYADPALEAILDDWIAEYPGSYIPHAARGIYLNHLGWIARGGYDAEPMTEPQRREANALFARAEVDLNRALELNPDMSPVHIALIRAHLARHDEAGMRAAMERALAELTDFHAVYDDYLGNLGPWWGGSVKAMRAFMEEIAARFPDDARYHVTEAKQRFIAAIVLMHEGELEEVRDLLDSALKLEKNPEFYRARGYIQFRLKQYEKALDDFNKAADRFTEDPFMIATMGSAYQSLGQRDKAIQFKTIAVSFDPYNPKILTSRAFTLLSYGRDLEAVADIQNTLILGVNDPDVHADRGKFFGSGPDVDFPGWPGSAEMRRRAYEEATKLRPEKADHWLGYAQALSAIGDCKARAALAEFERLCTAAGTCAAFAERMTPELASTTACQK
jgi:tetratricopeptide (TPR) repeat protein